MRTLLICHEEDPLAREGLARWLASFSELAGIVVLREGRARKKRRYHREVRRVGRLRFADVLAFRLYYRLFLAAADRRWEARELERLRAAYPESPSDVPVLVTEGANSPESADFVRSARPNMSFAICKQMLKKEIFSVPDIGTWIFHPGICPEYRNAHGCFWALANRDVDRVGMTLLRIDEGVDTGPVYGYFSYAFDEAAESHARIQRRVVYDNLPEIRAALEEVAAGTRGSLDTTGRESAMWGQPWLSSYLSWKRQARAARKAS